MLFRSEAIEARKQKLHGDVFLTSPLPFKVVTALLAAIFVFALIMLFIGSYDRTERVAGYLVPTAGLVKIQSGRFGTLQTLSVNEGDIVTKGATLLSIEAARLTNGNLSVEERSLRTLAQQTQNLNDRIQLEKDQLAYALETVQSELAAAELSAHSLESQIVLQREITQSAYESYTDAQQLLGQGYIAKSETERRRQAWLSQQTQGKLREQELEKARAGISQLQIRLGRLTVETETEIARLKAQLLDINNRELELLSNETYIIKAPVTGRVVSITSGTIGQSVVPQQPILTILPENSELVAELFVPSRAAGFVAEGQEVRLIYAAFPYQKFGSFPAVISKVTQTILSPNEIIIPFELQEPVYRVTARLETSSISVGDNDIALQSGMQLEANIVLENRSFIDWLLEPLRVVGVGHNA